MTDSWSEIYTDISSTSVAVNFLVCIKFTWQVTNGVVEINKIGLYEAMIEILDNFRA